MILRFILMSFAIAQHSWAEGPQVISEGGRETGNGGGAVVCRNGNTVTTRLLDLWEAAAHLTISFSNTPKEVQLARALTRLRDLDLRLATQVEGILSVLGQRRRAISTDFRLPPPSDTNLPLLRLPRHCALEGITRYNDSSDTMEVDETLESSATQTDLAARDFHEALYLVLRRGPWRETNSMSTRSLTGALFAEESIQRTSPLSGLEHATHRCQGGGYQVYFVPMSDGIIRIQFIQIANRYVMDRTSQDVALLPNDPIQNRVEFLSRLRRGFPEEQSTAPSHNFRGFDFTARLNPASQLEPAFRLLFNVSDGVSCNAPVHGRFPEQEICLRSQLRTVYSNFGISIRLAHQPEGEGTRLTCSALPTRN